MIKERSLFANLSIPVLLTFLGLLFLASFTFQNKNYQHSLPYYLSTSLSNSIFSISFNNEEIKNFNAIDSSESGKLNSDKGFYKFSDKPNLNNSKESIKDHFGYMVSHGFIAYIKTSKFFFGSLGDINSIKVMNILIHAFTTLFFANLFRGKALQISFLVIYGLNPLILHLATFPYYYFPVVGFSAGMIAIFEKARKGKINNIEIFIIALFLIFFVSMRPTLLVGFLFGFLYFLFSFKGKWLYVIIIILLLGIFDYIKKNSPSEYSPWFSIYVGLGGYGNIENLKLSDESAHEFLRDANFDKNKNSLDIELLKEKSIDLISENKITYFSNVLRNIIQNFGLGFHTENQTINHISLIIGLLTLFLFTKFKLRFLLLLIFSANIGYSLYFPPIPVYMASSYIILVYGWIVVLSKVYKKFSSAL